MLHKIEKQNESKNFVLGVYRQRKKRVFIKTWYGVVKDLRFYFLVTEYWSNKILHRIFETQNYFYTKYRLKVPKIVGYRLAKNSFSLIYEYISGKTLSSMAQKEQVEIINSILLAFQKITQKLTQKEKQYFRNISGKFYILTLPFIALITLLSKPSEYKLIFKVFIDCLKSAKSVESESLVLAHRDLEPDNIIINDSALYIVDLERAALTAPDYDIIHLSLKPNFKTIADALFKKMNIRPNEFLKNYIMIQYAAVHKDPKCGNFYMKALQAKYV